MSEDDGKVAQPEEGVSKDHLGAGAGDVEGMRQDGDTLEKSATTVTSYFCDTVKSSLSQKH